jgi:ABC-type sulfate transport system permease component
VKNFRINSAFRRAALFLFLCGVLALPLVAFGQSCALCYTQAASSGQKMIQALRDGILILVIPPTLASVGMLFVIHHKRNQVRRVDSPENSRLDW